MYESIAIGRQEITTGSPLDLGFLAECLVFYQKVHVVTDVDTFKFLVRTCGPDVLSQLFEMGSLELEFFDNMTGASTIDTGTSTERHDLITIGTNEQRFPQVARHVLEEMVGPSGKGFSKLFQRFSKYVSRSEYTRSILIEARTDIRDESYVSSAVRSLLAYAAPEYIAPEPLIFKPTVGFDELIRVTTNIDFKAANLSYHKHVPPEHSSLSAAFILVHMLDTKRDIEIASKHSSDIAIAPVRAIMGACKFGEVLRNANKNLKAIDLFQEVAFSGLPSIREAVNSRERSFSDVLRLVQQAQKFKKWLRRESDSNELRDAYCREVSHLDWADKLPPKSVRWLIMTGAGLALDAVAGAPIGTIGGLAFSAADALLLDRFIKGWRPNQFIEGPLRSFLRIG